MSIDLDGTDVEATCACGHFVWQHLPTNRVALGDNDGCHGTDKQGDYCNCRLAAPARVFVPQRTDRASGQKWAPPPSAHPWNGTPAGHVGGLCDDGWHTQCGQLPITGEPGIGQCACICHTDPSLLLTIPPAALEQEVLF